MYYNKPPLPPKIKEARCSSVDRILDSPAKQKTTQLGSRLVDTEGCTRVHQSPANGRKARSVDDLLDDDVQTDRTVLDSMDSDNNNNKEESECPEPPERSKSSSPFEKCCETETITVDNTPRQNEDQCDTNSNATETVSRKSREGSVLSTDSTISSTSDRTSTSDKRNNKKFFDKYVSKVKNYLKK